MIISVFAGVQGKRDLRIADELDNKLITQLVLSTKDAPVGETEACIVDGFGVMMAFAGCWICRLS